MVKYVGGVLQFIGGKMKLMLTINSKGAEALEFCISVFVVVDKE